MTFHSAQVRAERSPGMPTAHGPRGTRITRRSIYKTEERGQSGRLASAEKGSMKHGREGFRGSIPRCRHPLTIHPNERSYPA